MSNLIHAALLLHDAGKEISEENIEKVVKAAGVEADKAMIKAMVSSLKGINIEEAIKSASIPVAAAAPAQAESEAKPKKEEKKEDEGKKAEEAAAGLSALFG